MIMVISLLMLAGGTASSAAFSNITRPARRPIRQTGVMDSFDVLGNVFLITPGDNAERVLARVDAATTETYARHAAVNAAANLYWDAGLDEDADRMLKAQLERSNSPYYFMLNLAELAARAFRKRSCWAKLPWTDMK